MVVPELVKTASAVMFDNVEIAAEDLPQAAAVNWLAMDEKFLRRLMTQSGITIAALVIGMLVLLTILRIALADQDVTVNFAYLWLLVPLLAIPLFAWPLMSVPKMAYAVRDKDILYKSGVFWHTVTVIPFNRIQHVEKSSTPLDRYFDISTLQLFTAGGSGGDLKIHGLSAAVAEKLRAFIVEKLGSSIENH